MFHMHSNPVAMLSNLGIIIAMNEPYSVLSLPQQSFSIIWKTTLNRNTNNAKPITFHSVVSQLLPFDSCFNK